MHHWNIDVTDGGVTSENGSNVYFGLGGSYVLSETMAVNGGWTRYNIKATADITCDHWSAGLLFAF